jgi:hypothetical protein
LVLAKAGLGGGVGQKVLLLLFLIYHSRARASAL